MPFDLDEDDFELLTPQPHYLFTPRDYQYRCVKAVEEARTAGLTRYLIVKATGTGKTKTAAMVMLEEVMRGGRCLFLAHTGELLTQAIDAIRDSIGIEAQLEKAGEHASLSAKIVVASVQTMGRTQRLLGFPEGHFTLVVVDEVHRGLAEQHMRVMKWAHFGECSLLHEWTMPMPGSTYRSFARILGVTATPDRGDGRNLGEFFQKIVFKYGLVEACRDGYLVRPIVKTIPLKIDLKRHSSEEKILAGGDYAAEFLMKRIHPFLNAIAEQIAIHARDRKTVVFTPSIETARLLAEALCRYGVRGNWVSGACDNRSDKIRQFDQEAPGSALCCAMLLLEGWDCPTASCVVVLRPTKIRALYTQAVGRATRTLPGVIAGLDTAEERIEAIAASAKPNSLILDFLWLSDSLDLCKPCDIVVTRPELRSKIIKEAADDTDGDLIDMVEEANKELLEALQKATTKHSNKKSRTFDPIAFAVAVGGDVLKNYVPQTAYDALPAAKGQIEFLSLNGIDTSTPMTRGFAEHIVNNLAKRQQMGFASPRQLSLLKQLGMPDDKAMMYTSKYAGYIISGGHRFMRRPKPPEPQLPLNP